MRLFVALDIDEAIRVRLAQFVAGVREFAPDVRWARTESLHVTLKFIGETDPGQLAAIQKSLGEIRAASMEIRFRETGFFPTARSARVFWVGVRADSGLATLAEAVEMALAPLGIERERRAFSPHLTLARSGSGRPARGKEDGENARFRRVQQKLASMPPLDFGTMTPREYFLYESKVSSAGATYTKLARYALG